MNAKRTHTERIPRVARLLCCIAGAAGLMVAAGCSQQIARPEPVAFESQDWQYLGVKGSKLTTDHYVLYTTCTSKPLLDAMPGFVESCWAAYTELVPYEGPADQKMETYLFKQRALWERFTENFSPDHADIYKKIRSGGYSERGITVSSYGTRRSTFAVLAHEGLHQYLEATRGHRIPAWLNEGLATRFEAFDLDQKNQPVFKPEKNMLRRNTLRSALLADSLLPLTDILATHAGIEISKPATKVGYYYAHVWSLVLFLSQPPADNPYYEGFQRLLRDVGTDTMTRNARAFLAADTDGEMSPGEAIFRAYITDDLPQFEKDYKTFVYELLQLET